MGTTITSATATRVLRAALRALDCLGATAAAAADLRVELALAVSTGRLAPGGPDEALVLMLLLDLPADLAAGATDGVRATGALAAEPTTPLSPPAATGSPRSAARAARRRDETATAAAVFLYAVTWVLGCRRTVATLDRLCRTAIVGEGATAEPGATTVAAAATAESRKRKRGDDGGQEIVPVVAAADERRMNPIAARMWLLDLRSKDPRPMGSPPPPESRGELVLETPYVDHQPRQRRRIEWGCAAVKGWATTESGAACELHSSIEVDVVAFPLEEERHSCFVLADGHGGRTAADWFAPRIQKAVIGAVDDALLTNNDLDDPNTRRKLINAIRTAIKDLDDSFCSMRRAEYQSYARAVAGILKRMKPLPALGSSGAAYTQPALPPIPAPPSDDGCTALVVCIIDSGRWLLTAHVGDSRAVVVRRTRGSAGSKEGKPPSSTELELATVDHSVDHPRKAAFCMRAGGEWRSRKDSPPISLPDSVAEAVQDILEKAGDEDAGGGLDPGVAEALEACLRDARVFRPKGFTNPYGLAPKSMGLGDALGDVFMKLDPALFEARADVSLLPLRDGTAEYHVLMASDGVWGALAHAQEEGERAGLSPRACGSPGKQSQRAGAAAAAVRDNRPAVLRLMEELLQQGDGGSGGAQEQPRAGSRRGQSAALPCQTDLPGVASAWRAGFGPSARQRELAGAAVLRDAGRLRALFRRGPCSMVDDAVAVCISIGTEATD
ncbi:hypothetical protein HK405_003909 [Cladochytrium tenue]|nr:hypothetical protein HK405_003909 [Cladochytrium tenue]